MRGRNVRGLTLIELMVTIAIAAILLLVAAPSFENFQSNQQVRSAAAALVTDLQYTRSEAVKRNADITMSANPTWVDGWLITTAGGDTLKTGDALHGVTVTASGGATNVVYTGNGRSTASVDFTLEPAASGSSADPHCVSLSLSGKPVNRKGAC